MVFTGGLDTNGLRWVGEKVQSAVNNIRTGGMGGFGWPASAVPVNGDEGGGDSDMEIVSDSENEAYGSQYSVQWSPLDDKTPNPSGSKGTESKQKQPNRGCYQTYRVSNLSRETIQLRQGDSVERMDGSWGRSRVRNAEITRAELSDSATSIELSFRKPESSTSGALGETTIKTNQSRAQRKKKISNYSPSAPPLYGSALEINPVVEPSSPLRAHGTTCSSNWSIPANIDGARKAESVSPVHDASGSGISNSPFRTSAGVQVHGSPARTTPSLPVFHASVQGTWYGVIAYDACVRLCLRAWSQCYSNEVEYFLKNECAPLRDAFGLQHVLLQSEDELLAERPPSQPLSSLAAPNPVKTSGKIKLQVRKVKMGVHETPVCSFPSPRLPNIDYGNCHRRLSSMRSNLSSGLKSTWKDCMSRRSPASGSFSRQTLACIEAGGKRLKQGSAFLKTRTNTLCIPSSSNEIVQETYSCFLRLTSSPEEDTVRMQPGSGENRVLFPDSIRDDLIIQVHNSKGQHCGHALVQVAAIADAQSSKTQWWPIYSCDLEDEPVGRIQISMDYSSTADESNLKCGPIAETVAYDYVLEIAMKVQHFQQRNLLLQGSWRWLVTEFASYYGVSKPYTNLRYLSYVMDVATPTEDCLFLVYDLLSDVKAKSTSMLSHQENCILAMIEDQVKKTLALVFENYKSLEESSLSGMVDGFRPASGLAAPALAPAVQLYALLDDILTPEAQLKLCKFFQVATKKRLRMNCAETDELVLTNNDGSHSRDLSTPYQKMKSLILSIRNEILTDIQIQNQNILPIFIDLPNISSCLYSVNLCTRLRDFLVACPPRSLSTPVAELIIATADFQQDLSFWNINPIKGGVDAKELFHSHICLWIQDKRQNLLEQTKLDNAKWSGVRTEHGTTPLIDDMHNQLKEMLNEFKVIISRWPIYTSDLENVICDIEKAIVETLDKNYADVLSPLKDNLTNKILGFKYVQKLSRQPGNAYSVPIELGVLLNSMKRMLDVLWPQIETQLLSWRACTPDGYATGEHLNDAAALLRTKFRSYRLAIVEKLDENTRVHRKTKLKNIIQGSQEVESIVQSRMQPLEVLLRETIDHLHTVVDPPVFVELCRDFWDRMGQDVLHLLDNRQKDASWYKGLRVAVSSLNDIFASEMQRLHGNSLKEQDLTPPGSMQEVHSML